MGTTELSGMQFGCPHSFVGSTLFVAGPPAEADEREVYLLHGAPDVQEKMADQVAAFEGRRGGLILAVSKTDGSKHSAYHLDSIPVFDGMAAAGGRLYLTRVDGKLLCLGTGVGEPQGSCLIFRLRK